MEILLKENERIDDLERNGYRIIQNKSTFCFGMDAVLLSGFAVEGEKSRSRKELKIADLGTGTGIIPLLVYGKLMHNGCVRGNITGIEIQEEVREMAARSVKLNGLEEHIAIVPGDICNASQLLGKGCFDVVTSNPPYKKKGCGIVNPADTRAISRHEVLCSFEDVAREAAALLKEGGRFYLVHRPQRLPEIICALCERNLEPKRMRMVHSFAGDEAVMVLIEAVKGGKPFMKMERPLIIFETKDVYTEEIREMYYY